MKTRDHGKGVLLVVLLALLFTSNSVLSAKIRTLSVLGQAKISHRGVVVALHNHAPTCHMYDTQLCSEEHRQCTYLINDTETGDMLNRYPDKGAI